MNHILSALDPRDRQSLTSAARRVTFRSGQVLFTARALITDVFFPISGVVSSLVTLKDGDQVETAMIGCRGVLGSAVAFGADQHIASGLGRLQGEAWAVPARSLVDVADRNALLRNLLFRYQEYIAVQVQQTAVCNARHLLQQRLASWLLRARHTTESDHVSITQEELRLALGVQRGSVSMAAGELARAGAIEYRRGQIAIVDPRVLHESACECHEEAAQWREKLLSVRDGAAAVPRPSEPVSAGQLLSSAADLGDPLGPIAGHCAPDP